MGGHFGSRHHGAAVAEAVAHIGQHVGELLIRIGCHRHHGGTIVDAVDLAGQAVQHNIDRGRGAAEDAKRAGEGRSERAGCVERHALAIAAVTGEAEGFVECLTLTKGFEAIGTELLHQMGIFRLVGPGLFVGQVDAGVGGGFGRRSSELLRVGCVALFEGNHGLNYDARISVIEQLGDPFLEAGRFGKKRFREANGGFDYFQIAVCQCRQHEILVHCAESLERPDGVEAGFRGGAVLKEFVQCGND